MNIARNQDNINNKYWFKKLNIDLICESLYSEHGEEFEKRLSSNTLDIEDENCIKHQFIRTKSDIKNLDYQLLTLHEIFFDKKSGLDRFIQE